MCRRRAKKVNTYTSHKNCIRAMKVIDDAIKLNINKIHSSAVTHINCSRVGLFGRNSIDFVYTYNGFSMNGAGTSEVWHFGRVNVSEMLSVKLHVYLCLYCCECFGKHKNSEREGAGIFVIGFSFEWRFTLPLLFIVIFCCCVANSLCSFCAGKACLLKICFYCCRQILLWSRCK